MATNEKAKRLKARMEAKPLLYQCNCGWDGAKWQIRTDRMIICGDCDTKYKPEMFGLTRMKEVK